VHVGTDTGRSVPGLRELVMKSFLKLGASLGDVVFHHLRRDVPVPDRQAQRVTQNMEQMDAGVANLADFQSQP